MELHQVWDLPAVDSSSHLVGLLHLHPAIKALMPSVSLIMNNFTQRRLRLKQQFRERERLFAGCLYFHPSIVETFALLV